MIIPIDTNMFKKPTKLGIFSYVLFGGIGMFFGWFIFYIQNQFPLIRKIIGINQEAVQGMFLIFAILLIGISYLIGRIYRKFIKGVPRCVNCSNIMDKYEIDIVQEKIKCKLCGCNITFNLFPDKDFRKNWDTLNY